MKKICFIFICFSLLFAGCCPILVSNHPLSDKTKAAPPEAGMTGAWKLVSDEGEVGFIHIGKQENNQMILVLVEHNSHGEIETMNLPFFITKTDKHIYLNFHSNDLPKNLFDADDPHGYFFYRCRIEGNHLVLFSMEDNPVVHAIESDRLKGEITYKENVIQISTSPVKKETRKKVDCARITDQSEQILKFFESLPDDKIFPESKATKYLKISD